MKIKSENLLQLKCRIKVDTLDEFHSFVETMSTAIEWNGRPSTTEPRCQTLGQKNGKIWPKRFRVAVGCSDRSLNKNRPTTTPQAIVLTAISWRPGQKQLTRTCALPLAGRWPRVNRRKVAARKKEKSLRPTKKQRNMKSKGKGPANNASTFGGQCAPSSGCFIADRLFTAKKVRFTLPVVAKTRLFYFFSTKSAVSSGCAEKSAHLHKI